MVKNFLYAILLEVSMVACPSDRDEATTEGKTASEEQADTADIFETEEHAHPDASLFIIESGRVGHFTIGMPIPDIQRQVPPGFTIADTTLQMEGESYAAYLIRPEGAAGGLLVEQQCETVCRVWRIRVQSQDFKTAKGIGVGSKFGEVQELYQISYIGRDEGRLVAVSEESRLTFVLNSDLLELPDKSNLSASDIPANTLVKTLLVY